MFFNQKSFLVACAFALLSIMSFSLEAASGASLCSNPLQRICKDTLAQREKRNDYVSRLKMEISNEARINAAPKIEEMKKRIKISRPIKRLLSIMRIRNQEIMASAKKKIIRFESVVTNPEIVNKIKSYMYEAIDTSSFNMVTKANFKNVIKSIIVLNFGDFLERNDLEDEALAKFLSDACGTDGLVDNAFAKKTRNGDRYVLICPGLLITSNQAANDSDRLNNVLQAIAHEMGHHIDNSQVDNALYAPYLACLAKNYSENFNKTTGDKFFCLVNRKDSMNCKAKVILNHADELIADQWGIRATVIHARGEAYSSADAEQMLAESWAKLCGTEDEGIHPSGDFRIGTLLRKNPEISEYLSCSADVKPGCSFEGESAI